MRIKIVFRGSLYHFLVLCATVRLHNRSSFERKVVKGDAVLLPVVTGLPVVAESKGHRPFGHRDITMKLARVVFERNEITVIEKRIEIVDADHRVPFIQKVEVKGQLVDALFPWMSLGPRFL